jgi:hypothetical protein
MQRVGMTCSFVDRFGGTRDAQKSGGSQPANISSVNRR